ncbi:MAG: hypothetical protein LBQ96_03590 [Fusobacteriaceae bacterium]|jgi:hypothetical protein|nr:hypothetical protein [Fusobacteriaceae bacterium]
MGQVRMAGKSLTRFFSRKKIYVTSMLIALMFTGKPGVAIAAAGPVGAAREELLEKIRSQKEDIKTLIAENEAKIKELKTSELLNLRRGDFYSRPFFRSTLVFFSYWLEKSAKGKDRTEKEFKEDLARVVEAMGGKQLQDEETTKRLYEIALERLTQGQGTVDDDRRYEETIDVGANVKPAAPYVPQTAVSIPLGVEAPEVSLGTLPEPKVMAIAAPVIEPPAGISQITSPDAPEVQVTTPGAIDPVSVFVEAPKTPGAPKIEPKAVSIPDAPKVTAPKIDSITPSTVSFNDGSFEGNYYWHASHGRAYPSAIESEGTGKLILDPDTEKYVYAYDHWMIDDVPSGSTTSSNAYIGFWGIEEDVLINVDITVANNPGRAIEIDEATNGNDYFSSGTLTLAESNTIGIDLQGTHYTTGSNLKYDTNSPYWPVNKISQTMIVNQGTIHGQDDAAHSREKQQAMGFNNFDHSSDNTMTRLVNTGTITMDAKNSLGIQLKPEKQKANNTDSHTYPGIRNNIYGGAVLMQAINEEGATININNSNSYALSTSPFDTETKEGIFGYHYDPAVFTDAEYNGKYTGYYKSISGIFNKGTLNISGAGSIGIGLFHPIQAVRNEETGIINVKSGEKAVGVYTEVATKYLAKGDEDLMAVVVTDPAGAGTKTVEVAGTVNVANAEDDHATKSAGVRTGGTDGKITVFGAINVSGIENYGAVQASTDTGSASLIINTDALISVNGNKNIGFVLMDGKGSNNGIITATSSAETFVVDTSTVERSGNIGFFGEKGSFTNETNGSINATGKGGIAVILKKDADSPVFDNNGAISIGPGTDNTQPLIGVYNNGGIFTMNSTGTITLDTNTEKAVGLYNVAGTATIYGEITVGETGPSESSIGVVASSSAPVVFDTGAGLNLKENAIGLYSADSTSSSFTLDDLSVNLANGAVFMYYDDGTPDVDNLSKVTFGVLGDGASLIYADKNAQVTLKNAQDITAITQRSEGFIPYVANGGNAKITLAADLTTDGKVGVASSKGGSVTINSGNTLQLEGNSGRVSNDVGIYSDSGTIVNDGTIRLVSQNAGMIGIFGEFETGTASGAITNSNTGTITLSGTATGNIGIFAQEGTKVNNAGEINIHTDKSIGIYLLDSDLDLNPASATNINFETATPKVYASESIGIYNDGKKTIAIGEDISFTSPNENKNILIYSTNEGTIVNNADIAIHGVTAPDKDKKDHKTIGFYLDGQGKPNTYDGSGGTLTVDQEAAGIYSKNDNTLHLGELTANGAKTVGAFLEGDATIDGIVNANSGAVGVYGDNGGLVTVATGGLSLNLNAGGLGMYLQKDAYAAGKDITVTNNESTSNVGIYYDPTSNTITHETNVILNGSNPLTGIYVATNKILTIGKDITVNTEASVGGMAGSGSELILGNDGNINLMAVAGVGLYTEEGIITNSGVISAASTAAGSTGMAGISAASRTAVVKNPGTIDADAVTGIYLGGTGTTAGFNTGDIVVSTGTAVYIKDSDSTFDGAGGTIITTGSHGIALYLDSTAATAVTDPGTLDLAPDGIAVYADNSPVDFEVAPKGSEIIGVAAVDYAAIQKDVTVGDGGVGVYVLDGSVTIDPVTITTGNAAVTGAGETKNPVGVFLASGIGAYTVGDAFTGPAVNAKNGIGIYIEGAASTTAPTTNLTLKHSTVTTENGVAVFVGKNATFDADGILLDVQGGEGIYVAAGATADIGQNGTDTISFASGKGGIGIYNDGGTVNLGPNLVQVGNGTMAATKNGDFSYAGAVSLSGVTALLGIYDSDMTRPNTVSNSGNLTITDGGIGIAAIEGGSTPSDAVTLTNSGVIRSTGKNTAGQPSIALYTDAADIVNDGVIEVGRDGFGIYDESDHKLSNRFIDITGDDATGIFMRNKLADVTASNISGTATGSTGIAIQNITADGTLNADRITLGNESVGILADNASGNANGVTVKGNIVLGDGDANKRAIGVIAKGSAAPSKLIVSPAASFTIGNNGIGVYADRLSSVSFDADSFAFGTDGVYAYTTGGSIILTGGTVRASDSIGLIFAGGGTFGASGGSVLAAEGGAGIYVRGADVSAIPDGLVSVQGGASASSPYTMGIYYDTVAGNVNIPGIYLKDYHAAGAILKNTEGTATNAVTVPGEATDSIGVVADSNSTVAAKGGISVSGRRNAGIYAKDSKVVVDGIIAVGRSAFDPNRAESSIGVYQNGNGYTGTGTLQIDDNSIGYYGVGLTGTSTHTGNLNLGASAIGISAEGSAAGDDFTLTGNIAAGDKAIGISGKNIDLSVKGDMDLGSNGTLGVVSTGSGDVNYRGTVTTNSGGSLGIYKKTGNGESALVRAGGSVWSVGDADYGIYAQTEGNGAITVINDAPMDLGKSALGIYADGNVQVTNNATIRAGETEFGGDNTSGHTETQKHLNSVAIYAAGGADIVNKGTLEAKKDHSLGIYAEGYGTRFTNEGVIEVNNGGIGMLIRDEAVGVNNGTINLGADQPADTWNIGMAAYKDAKIINNGLINVGAGIGMLIGHNGILENYGDINVTNGVGIQGGGAFLNKGNIHVLSAGGKAENILSAGIADVGAVQITAGGVITVNGQYVSVGGTLYTDGDLVVDGAFVDVTSGVPVFDAQNVSGEVNILPDYALTGNGQTYEIKNFITTALTTTSGSKITPVLGPLFVGKVTTEGDLLIAKRPYTDITIGKRFDTLYVQWDEILAKDPYSPDSLALKSLNYYLAGLYDTQTYTAESARMLSETRGDIYATIQKRMENMQDAFDASFEELIDSRNYTRNTDKYSVMYRQGNFRDKTVGIDDYDYDIAGLYYMKDYDGRKFGDKYGWSAAFAVGNFRFDDAPALHVNSKERIYSARLGLHLVKGYLENDKWQWTSRLEAGYNRHEATRRLELETLRTNRASYDTWSVSFDNKLERTILRTVSTKIGVYGALNLEYGNVSQFKERLGKEGALRLEIKGNDYFSIRPEIGATAQKKLYLGGKLSAKLEGKLAWAYELGDHYEGNRVRSVGSDGNWMRLVAPEKDKHALIGAAVLTLEKADHYGISIEVRGRKMTCKEKIDVVWGLRLHYKFGH